MKVVSPKIYLVSESSFFDAAVTDFLSDEGVAWRKSLSAAEVENAIEIAGRICYMSFSNKQSPKDNFEYIRNLIENGHESVLEHVSWSFLISGVSRGFTHQLVRHRVGFSYSQLSQQYYDESNANVVLPNGYMDDGFDKAAWLKAIETAFVAYREIISSFKSGVGASKKEKNRDVMTVARSVLPNAVESKIYVTANARALRHFLDVRGGIEGDWEMREVSRLLYEIVSVRAPSIFADFGLVRLADGSLGVKRKAPI